MNDQQYPFADELYLRPSLLKIFVSSEMRSKKLASERAAAAEAIEALGSATAWYWERDAVAGPYSAEAVCLNQAATSDGLILLISDEITRVVEQEFLAAQSKHVPIFIFLEKDTTRDQITSDFVDLHRRTALVTKSFAGISELKIEITRALNEWLIRSSRTTLLSFRGRTSYSPMPLSALDEERASVSEAAGAYGQIPVARSASTDDDSFIHRMVRYVEQQLEKHNYRGAIEDTMAIAEQLNVTGHSKTVLRIVELIRSKVPSSSSQPIDEAWLLNAEGIALQNLCMSERARTRFNRMEDIGRELGDLNVESTALQNLSIVFHVAGEFEPARQLLQRSLNLKLEANDHHGAVQLGINGTAQAVEVGDLDRAEKLLEAIEGYAVSVGDPHLRSSFYGNKGLIMVKRLQFSNAETLFKLALTFARKSGDLRAVATSLQNLGTVNMDQHEFGIALRWFRRALRLAEQIDSDYHRRIFHSSIAIALHGRGRLQEAMSNLEAARKIASTLTDRYEWAVATANLGAMSIEAHDIDNTTTLLNQALTTFEQLNDHEWQVRVLRNLLTSYGLTGDFEAMQSTIEEALHLIPATDHSQKAAILRHGAGVLIEQPALREQAADLLTRALLEIKLTGAESSLAERAAEAGALLAAHGAFKLSIPVYTQALGEYTRHGDKTGEFYARNDRAIAYTSLDLFPEARQDYEACLDLAHGLNETTLIFQTLLNHGEMERRADNHDEAVSMLREAVALAKEIGDEHAEAEALGNLGIALGTAGNPQEAVTAFESCLQIARRLEDPRSEALAIGGLATLAFTQERFNEAARFYKSAARLEQKTGDVLHMIEDLAGLAQSYAALGDADRSGNAAQQLVNAAQQSGSYALAMRTLTQLGSQFYDHDQLEPAASAYSAAIIGSLVAAEIDKSDEQLVMPIVALVLKFSKEGSAQRKEFIHAVLESVASEHGLDEDAVEVTRSSIAVAQERLHDSAVTTDH